MRSLKCDTCGLVNFASAGACRRCAAPLSGRAAGAPYGGKAPKPILLRPETFNGMGVDLRDYRKLAGGAYLVTRCVTILWVPIIPLSVWVVRPIDRELSLLTTSESYNYELVEDRPLDLQSVLRLYGLFLLWAALAAGPFFLFLMLMRGDGTPEDRPGYFVGVMFLLSIPWSLCLPLWLKRRRDRLYALANKSPVARAPSGCADAFAPFPPLFLKNLVDILSQLL